MYVIKHLPEDFVVEELDERTYEENGRYLIVAVTKRLKNTEETAQFLADRFRLARKDVGYAGSKDRHAVTTQRFSLRGVTKERLASVDFGNLTVRPLGYADEPLHLGALEGNRFAIVVRNLDGNETLELPASIPNYFDEQRFSTGNAAIGEALVRKRFSDALALVKASSPDRAEQLSAYQEEHPGDVVGALLRLPRQLLRLYLHSYQSLLWNEALAAYVRTVAKDVKKILYSQGAFLFTDETVAPLSIPIPGFGFDDDGQVAGRLVATLLSEEGLSPRDFVIRQLPNLSLEGTDREAIIAVQDFTASPFEDDDQFPGKKNVTLRFSLPKGSYATIVVKAILG